MKGSGKTPVAYIAREIRFEQRIFVSFLFKSAITILPYPTHPSQASRYRASQNPSTKNELTCFREALIAKLISEGDLFKENVDMVKYHKIRNCR